jgi:hypothetical protein
MSLEEDLLALEERFWRAAGDGGFYREHFADDGLLVLPGGVGVLPKEVAITAVDAAGPWTSFAIEDVRFVRLGDDSAALVYRAQAARGDQPYAALITSVYARRDGAWQLALHQQTAI